MPTATTLAAAFTLAAATHATPLPDPSPLEQGISATYTFQFFSDHSSNPYAQNMSPFGAGRAPVSGDDLNRLADLLTLDDDQRELARGMADELEDEKRLINVRFTEASADARAHHAIPGNNNWAEVQRLQREARQQRDQQINQLSDNFYTELRLMLTPEQEARWRFVELDRQRDRQLAPGATLFAESADPVALADSLNLPNEPAERIRPILDQYLNQLEPLLRNRTRLATQLAERAIEQQEKQQSLWQNPELRQNPELLQQRQAEMQSESEDIGNLAIDTLRAGARIAQLNRRTLDRLTEALSPDHAEPLEQAIENLAETRAYGFADSSPTANRFGQQFFGADSRPGQVFALLLPEDTDEEDRFGRNAFPDEMKENLSSNQLELVNQIESLVEELAGTGFAPGMMSTAGADTLTEQQREQLRQIRDDFQARHQRLKDQIERESRADNDPDNPAPQILVNTGRGTVHLQRVFDDPQEQMAAFQNAQSGQDNERLTELMQQRIELEQDTINQIRQVLTIKQREAIANF